MYKDKIINLFKKNHLLSISDIHQKIPGVDYSTVYRNVGRLVAEREIKRVVFDKDRVMYEINNKADNHDHFVCTDCGHVDELDRSFVDYKFLEKHLVTDVLVRGLCNNCN